MNKNIILRTARLVSKLKEKEADAFVILTEEDANWESLFYMSGFRGTSGALLVYKDAQPELILDARYAEQGARQSPHAVLPQRESLLGDVRDRLLAHGAERMLCESAKTWHASWQKLAARGKWADGGELISELRRTKDAQEVADIRKAAQIGAAAFMETLDCVKPGMTEKAFESLLNYNICRAGAAAGFDMIVASGERSVMPHGRAGEKEMAAGEWATVDYGARWNGYFCDITRNFFIGSPTEEACALHELVARAHAEAASMLAPGLSGTAAHNRALAIFEEKNLGKYFTHSLGHSFGLEIHEAPQLSPRKDFILQAGDVVTVEPGLYIPGTGGMRLEDDYLITEDGAERLTDSLNQCFYTI
ncbi:MAG: Xaa-Pro peptidase family protein [Cloacibacillus sp.]